MCECSICQLKMSTLTGLDKYLEHFKVVWGSFVLVFLKLNYGIMNLYPASLLVAVHVCCLFYFSRTSSERHFWQNNTSQRRRRFISLDVYWYIVNNYRGTQNVFVNLQCIKRRHLWFCIHWMSTTNVSEFYHPILS
jgi:hypothetical protein